MQRSRINDPIHILFSGQLLLLLTAQRQLRWPKTIGVFLEKFLVVSVISKTQFIGHYAQTLGAKLFGGNRMFIDTKEAQILTIKYFKDFRP